MLHHEASNFICFDYKTSGAFIIKNIFIFRNSKYRNLSNRVYYFDASKTINE